MNKYHTLPSTSIFLLEHKYLCVRRAGGGALCVDRMIRRQWIDTEEKPPGGVWRFSSTAENLQTPEVNFPACCEAWLTRPGPRSMTLRSAARESGVLLIPPLPRGFPVTVSVNRCFRPLTVWKRLDGPDAIVHVQSSSFNVSNSIITAEVWEEICSLQVFWRILSRTPPQERRRLFLPGQRRTRG